MSVSMAHHLAMPAEDWVRRVNRAWLVRGNLNDHAEAWVDYLAANDPKRLQQSCEISRELCGLRDTFDDPKPWFYAGLFSLATVEEARRFLELHRVTKATVPAMADDESVKLWQDRIGHETAELLARIRIGIVSLLAGTKKLETTHEQDTRRFEDES